MDWVYRGLYLIGDKKTGRITNVQVEDNNERRHSLPSAVYLARGIEPDHRTLPWSFLGIRLAAGSGESLLIGGCHFIFRCMRDAPVVTCPQCGTKFGTAKSLDVYRCPECFARFNVSGTRYRQVLIFVASALIALAFVFFVVWTWP